MKPAQWRHATEAEAARDSVEAVIEAIVAADANAGNWGKEN